VGEYSVGAHFCIGENCTGGVEGRLEMGRPFVLEKLEPEGRQVQFRDQKIRLHRNGPGSLALWPNMPEALFAPLGSAGANLYVHLQKAARSENFLIL